MRRQHAATFLGLALAACGALSYESEETCARLLQDARTHLLEVVGPATEDAGTHEAYVAVLEAHRPWAAEVARRSGGCTGIAVAHDADVSEWNDLFAATAWIDIAYSMESAASQEHGWKSSRDSLLDLIGKLGNRKLEQPE